MHSHIIIVFIMKIYDCKALKMVIKYGEGDIFSDGFCNDVLMKHHAIICCYFIMHDSVGPQNTRRLKVR